MYGVMKGEKGGGKKLYWQGKSGGISRSIHVL